MKSGQRFNARPNWWVPIYTFKWIVWTFELKNAQIFLCLSFVVRLFFYIFLTFFFFLLQAYFSLWNPAFLLRINYTTIKLIRTNTTTIFIDWLQAAWIECNNEIERKKCTFRKVNESRLRETMRSIRVVSMWNLIMWTEISVASAPFSELVKNIQGNITFFLKIFILLFETVEPILFLFQIISKVLQSPNEIEWNDYTMVARRVVLSPTCYYQKNTQTIFI